MRRKITKKVRVGDLEIGGGSSISIQSMTNTDTRDIDATVRQILELEEAGCQLARVAVVDLEAAKSIEKIKKNVHIPIVADIHFDYRLAIESMKSGVDKIRINPGNIGDIEKVKKVVDEAKLRDIPIRIGVNAGSLEKDILEEYGSVTAKGLVKSALRHVKILEDLDFEKILVSIKASSVSLNVDSYRLLSEKIDYPLHLGLTEAGTPRMGTIKSAIGIGTLLLDGIGDTLRVSLTSDPVLEVKSAKDILSALDLSDKPQLISCPTCGRTQVDLISIAEGVEKELANINKNIKVAVMGCAVNGPGEAREADIGIAGGKGDVVLFKKGEIVKKIVQEEAVKTLIDEINRM